MLLDNMIDLDDWLWRPIFAETMPHYLIRLLINRVEMLRRCSTGLAKSIRRLNHWIVLFAPLVNYHALIIFLLTVIKLINCDLWSILSFLINFEIIANFLNWIVNSLNHLLAGALITSLVFQLVGGLGYSRRVARSKIHGCLFTIKIRYVFERCYWPIDDSGLRFLRILWFLRCAKWVERLRLNFSRVTTVAIRFRSRLFSVNYYTTIDNLSHIFG